MRSASRNSSLVFAVVLAIATAVAYLPAWHGGFIWDDDAYITKNPLLTAPDGLRRIWFSLDSPSQYFPLVYTTFRFEHALWGLNTTGYHLVNIALHIINALLVWRVLVRLGVPGAMLAAAIFALHPVHVESVAWITERKNVLMGVFFLLAARSWISFVDAERKRPWKQYVLALLFYALALFSKTTACTLPAALLLILWLRRQRITAARVLQITPFVILGGAMGAVTIWWERYHQGTRGEFFAIGALERLLVASRAVWFYLGKLFWPAKLTFIYPRWDISSVDPIAYVWVLACVTACIAIFFLRRRLGRGLEVAALFFVATLSPVLGFIMLYTFRYTFVADHYQYIASIGPIALCSAFLATCVERHRAWRQAMMAGSAALVVCLAILTWKQATMYSNIEALWRTTIERNPRSWMAHNNLGIELAQQGRTSEAIAAYQRTAALAPNFPEAHYNLATALLKEGDASAALFESDRAISLKPNDSDAHIARGNALAASGRRTEAKAEYETACSLRPESAEAHHNLGLLLLQDGNAADALSHFEQALRERPDGPTRVMVANALLALHRNAEAISEFEAALRSAPDDVVALCNLAWALATSSDSRLRDGARALTVADKANQLTGSNDPVVLRSLAAACAEIGQLDRAQQIAETALQRASETGQTQLADSLRNEISVYRSGAAFRE